MREGRSAYWEEGMVFHHRIGISRATEAGRSPARMDGFLLRTLWSPPSPIDPSAVSHCPCARAYVSCQNLPESKRCRLISVGPASPMRLQNHICSDSPSVGVLQDKASLIPLLVETIIFWDISSPKLTHLFGTFAALGFRLVPLKLNICHVSIASV